MIATAISQDNYSHEEVTRTISIPSGQQMIVHDEIDIVSNELQIEGSLILEV